MLKLEVLGTVQDGGVPHLGYTSEINEEARQDITEARFVDSLLIKDNDRDDSVRYLINATPDIRFQIAGEYIDGVFISDSIFGSLPGLLHFGEAALDASDVEVMCSTGTEEYLQKNDPYRYLLDRENIHTNVVHSHDEIDVLGGTIQPVKVERCGGETFAFEIRGDERTVFYARDFESLTDHIKGHIEEADVAIICGTFWDREEVKRFEEIPHAPISETMPELEDLDTQVYYTYVNHTNPVLKEDSEERQELEDRGFGLVEKGMEIEL